jgi:hypothetical protein
MNTEETEEIAYIFWTSITNFSRETMIQAVEKEG